MQNQLNIGYPILLLVATVAAFFGLIWANSSFLPQSFGQADFALGWTASYSWLINGQSPYNPTMLTQVQQMTGNIAGATIADPVFVYPMYGILFFGPFTLIHYPAARITWMILIEICFMLLVVFSIRLTRWKTSYWETGIVILLLMVWFNGASSIFSGQFDIITSLLLVVALFLILQKQDVGAGFLLALATVKPDTSLLLVIYIIVWSLFSKRRRLFWSIWVSICFLLVITILLFPQWPLQWLQIMVPSLGQMNIYQTALSLIARAMPGVRTPLNVVLHGIVLIFMLIGWIKSIKKDDNLFLWTALMTLAVTNLVGYRVNISYSILLIPCLFLIFQSLARKVGTWSENCLLDHPGFDYYRFLDLLCICNQANR